MSRLVRIGDFYVGDDHPVFFVSEIGINHNGSLETAKRLIDVAVTAGCSAVKFQKRTVEMVYSPEELARPRESPFGGTNGDLKRALELGQEEYENINRYCHEKGILWFASCWDEPSVDFVGQFDPPCYKVASASLTDGGLLRHIRNRGKPVILSTGMSTLEQIRRAVEMLGRNNLILLHCVSTYPADLREINLRVIETLKTLYPDVPVGYSGHERGIYTSLCAVVHGACLIERHITLDRTMWGSDQAASVEPRGVKLLVDEVRYYEQARGDGVKGLLESEIPVMKKLRRKG